LECISAAKCCISVCETGFATKNAVLCSAAALQVGTYTVSAIHDVALDLQPRCPRRRSNPRDARSDATRVHTRRASFATRFVRDAAAIENARTSCVLAGADLGAPGNAR
jgi:hypothetical protein